MLDLMDPIGPNGGPAFSTLNDRDFDLYITIYMTGFSMKYN